MEHQLQDARTPVAAVMGLSSTDPFQRQVVDNSAVPQRHVAKNLRRRGEPS